MPVKRIPLLFAALFWFACPAISQDTTNFHLPATEMQEIAFSLTDSIAPNNATVHSMDTIGPYQKAHAVASPKPISLRSVLVPVAMISYGALTFTSKGLQNLNLSLRDDVAGSTNRHVRFDDYSKYIPAIAVYGLNLAGVKGKHNLVDRTMLYGMSNLIGSGIVFSTKRLTNVLRPDSSNRKSFPSGHTAGAFIAAEFMRQEYKDVSVWYGVAGYAVAAGTGILRMYNNKHWFNDVVAGAGVGILSTRIAYWLYPKLKNAVFKNKNSSTLVAPTYQQGALGLGLVHTF